MTRNDFVTALGFGVFAVLSSTLYTTPSQAFHLLGHSYSHVGVGSAVWKVAEDCPRGSTFSVERGKCVCPPGMKMYRESLAHSWGGRWGCYDPRNERCAPGEIWDDDQFACVKRPVKNIGKKKPVMPGGSGGAGGGGTDCGPGYSYDAERGCRKIKSIGKKKVIPETSGGVGGDAEAAAGPGHSPSGGGGGGDGDAE